MCVFVAEIKSFIQIHSLTVSAVVATPPHLQSLPVYVYIDAVDTPELAASAATTTTAEEEKENPF